MPWKTACGTQVPLAICYRFIDHANQLDEHRERMLMEPIAERSPKTGIRGPFGFFTTRIGAKRNDGRLTPSLAEMEAELQGLKQRLRSPRLRLSVVGTLQRLPMMIPAVARVSVAVLRRDASRSQPPIP
jgi:hypothetical protein